MYSGWRLCRFSGQNITEGKTIHPKCPVVYPLSTWAADHHQGHHSPILNAITGSTAQPSKGGSNSSLSPSSLGEGTCPASPRKPRCVRSGGNQRDEGDVATISGFTDTQITNNKTSTIKAKYAVFTDRSKLTEDSVSVNENRQLSRISKGRSLRQTQQTRQRLATH